MTRSSQVPVGGGWFESPGHLGADSLFERPKASRAREQVTPCATPVAPAKEEELHSVMSLPRAQDLSEPQSLGQDGSHANSDRGGLSGDQGFSTSPQALSVLTRAREQVPLRTKH